MSNKILSYRGLLADGGQDTILLSTKKGEVGYRIIKFQCIQAEPGELSVEQTVKIYKVSQSTINNTVDFSDNTLLGVALWHKSSGDAYNPSETIIFDQEIFNQDIFVTSSDVGGSTAACNYYMELEVIKLSEDQAMVATLKDIRNNS
jgi:hypothetical protein